jgi:hypothetical protein
VAPGWLDRHQRALASAASVLLLLALHQAYGIVHFPFDSAEYWDLARASVFFEYASHRGYFFPLALLPIRWACEHLGAPVAVYRISMSAIYGLALALLLPATFVRAFGGRLTFMRRLIPVVLLAALMPGVLLYPLSDLPAFLLAVVAVGLALRGLDCVQRGAQLAWIAAAGAAAGAAYNTRPIFAAAVVALLALVLLAQRARRTGAVGRSLAGGALALGVIAALLPQLAINSATHGVATLAVRPIVNQRSVFTSQLVWGLTLQRYETTVMAGSPGPSVYYIDPRGERLYRQLAAGGDLFSVPYYASSVLTHPFEFARLYARHVVNGLDLRDGIVYTRSPSPRRNAVAVFNVGVLLAALWIAWARWRHRAQPSALARPSNAWPYAFATLLLPVAAIVPGSVETRFFLPLHLLAYAAIAFHFDGSALRNGLRARWLMVVIVSAALATGFAAVSRSTMANLQYAWPEAYRQGSVPR